MSSFFQKLNFNLKKTNHSNSQDLKSKSKYRTSQLTTNNLQTKDRIQTMITNTLAVHLKESKNMIRNNLSLKLKNYLIKVKNFIHLIS